MKKHGSNTRLFWSAVHKGPVATVVQCLKRGISPDAVFPLGKASPAAGQLRPLSLAAASGQLGIVEALLTAGADVDAGQAWQTPLLAAVANGHAAVADLLIAHGARVHFLIQVAQDDRIAVKRALARNKKLANTTDDCHCTALHYAAKRFLVPMARLLVKAGAEVEPKAGHAETPLAMACDGRGIQGDDVQRQKAMIEYLIAAGADVNHANKRGVTPLHIAVRARSVGAVEQLLKHGADKNARDKSRGSTPLTRAQFSTGASGTKGRQAEGKAIQRLLAAQAHRR